MGARVGRREIGLREDAQPHAAAGGTPLAIESPPAAGLSVGEHGDVVLSARSEVASASVRTRESVVILDLKGGIEVELDRRPAVFGDRFERVAPASLPISKSTSQWASTCFQTAALEMSNFRASAGPETGPFAIASSMAVAARRKATTA
jgi:hypothetical protein